MKILHINAVYGVGSTGTIVSDIHLLSLDKGIDSYVAYSTAQIEESQLINGYKIGSKLDKKLHALLSRINGKQAYFSQSSTRKLLAYIDFIGPDVVHLHNLHSNFINLNILLKYLSKNCIATVVTLHDCWFYTGGCFHYTFDKCNNWLEKCGNCPKKRKDTPAFFFDKSSLIRIDREKYFSDIPNLTVVGVSKWIANEARKTFFSKKEICVIYNGVDLEIYKYKASELRKKLNINNKFVILGAANKWLTRSNRDFLFSVASAIEEDMLIVIFGYTNESKSNLPNNIICIDYVCDPNEMCKIYSMADVFVNCTREESLSLVNLEAQACGTPVITFRNTGAKETVDETCGFSVCDGDLLHFMEKIFVVKDKGRKYYSEACREWIRTNFLKETNYEKYIDLYHAIKKDSNGEYDVNI